MSEISEIEKIKLPLKWVVIFITTIITSVVSCTVVYVTMQIKLSECVSKIERLDARVDKNDVAVIKSDVANLKTQQDKMSDKIDEIYTIVISGR